ncbi:MAG TPA: hypothetical protein VE933_00105 [Chitinophagaceae bacterium]|nr:hypothetical protein [Chitinophagaceae bacterium]
MNFSIQIRLCLVGRNKKEASLFTTSLMIKSSISKLVHHTPQPHNKKSHNGYGIFDAPSLLPIAIGKDNKLRMGMFFHCLIELLQYKSATPARTYRSVRAGNGRLIVAQ